MNDMAMLNGQRELAVLHAMDGGESFTVEDLARITNLPEKAVSKYLKQFHDDELVVRETQRTGKTLRFLYRLAALTTERLADRMIRTVALMDKDEKAHLRARLRRELPRYV